MDADLQACLTFHLRGRTPGIGLPAIDALDLRPALLAGYRDLTALRYDFPVVLAQHGNDAVFVHSLSGLIDDLLHDIVPGEAADRVTRHVLRLERQMRTLVAQGEAGVLSDLWSTAAGRLGARADDQLRDSLDRARAALGIDGEVIDCDKALPSRLFTHAWKTAQQQKAHRFHDKASRLIVGLSELLRADVARSNEGRSPQNLRASVGSSHHDAFDFDAMSRMLHTMAPAPDPPDRSKRIRALIATLESQRFFPALDGAGARGLPQEPYGFVFDTCGDALAAYRERLPGVIEIAKAIALAELEIEGTATDSARLAVVEDLDADHFSRVGLALFPDYLVLINIGDMGPIEQATLIEILAAGPPIKVLVQTDDLLDDPSVGRASLRVHARQLAAMAVSLNDVYVLQSSASHLFQSRDQIMRGINWTGPALFSVFSGAAGASSDLPPYLMAAAAMDSRAFPAFVYDPSAGPDWASRLDVQANPQPDADWPIRSLTYEDEAHQRIREDLAFTFVDFLACDRRNGRHLAGAPRSVRTDGLSPVNAWLAAEPTGMPTSVPSVLMVDRDHKLHRMVVDEKLMRDARRCREMWHSLQELGGIHNSHAERLLGRERQAREDDEARARGDREKRAGETRPAGESVPATAEPSAVAAAVVANPDEARSPDEPYIDTPRCSTCNECVQINNRMFAYNENRQAYIADASAGSYRQLVEAAESCQVSVIHPGKPRDASEPGLDELVTRAAPFL